MMIKNLADRGRGLGHDALAKGKLQSEPLAEVAKL